MKLAVKGEGGLVTVIVCWDVTDCCGVPLSVVVSVTVKDPDDEKVCVADAPDAIDPSPKLHLKL